MSSIVALTFTSVAVLTIRNFLLCGSFNLTFDLVTGDLESVVFAPTSLGFSMSRPLAIFEGNICDVA